MSNVYRAIADGETEGFVKILHKKGSDQILGATIVAPQIIVIKLTGRKYAVPLQNNSYLGGFGITVREILFLMKPIH